MSRKPSVASSAVRAPRRSMTALVASVVPCTNTATSQKPRPASARISRTPSRTASSGRCGVVSSLRVSRRPPSSSTTSVNVPPMSTAMRKSLTTLVSRPLIPRNGRDRRPASPALQFAGHAAYGRLVTDMAPTLRARIYNLLRYTDPSPAARRWRAMHLTVLGIGLLAVVLLSIDELPREIKHWLRVVIWSVTVVFFLEYLVRLWVAPEITRFDQQSPTMARARWAISAPGLIGLLAVLPAVMLAGGYGITGSDTASVFCILWILKLGLHAPALQHARPRRVQRARADRQRADPVRHRADARRHRGPPAGARAPARAVRQPAGRDVVGRRHPHHDGLRRRRAAHRRRHA